MKQTLFVMSITFISIRSSTVSYRVWAIGRAAVFTSMLRRGHYRLIGVVTSVSWWELSVSSVGWAKRSVPTDYRSMIHVGTALRAFAHPTDC